MNKCKRFLALLLVLCMTLSVVPFSAFAADGSDETTDGESQNATVETVAEETTADETTGETTAEETTEETTVGETTEATTVETSAEEEDEPQEEDIASFLLTAEADAYSLTMGTKPADGSTRGQPFSSGTGGSTNFRIPALVTLSNGTLVAACDARWNNSFDGYGLDTIVSYSTDKGANWNYTFANYLGDNGNVYNTDSTAFIDPALAVTQNDTIFMLVDLYPHGTYIGNVKAGTGFDEYGHLLLSDNNGNSYSYYVGDFEDGSAQIYQTDGTLVDGYAVDEFYNISSNGVNTNLFFSDSPYQVLGTSYLYLTKSTDGGKNWSAPMMLNPQVKGSGDMFYGVGPGRGLVTSTGRIMFPCYTYTTQDGNTSVIYSDDGMTWHRSASTSVQTSEAALVEADGRIYMFTRHGGYFVSSDNGETWGGQQNVGISYNTGCQISAITYSKKIDGKTAILLSAPSNTSSRSNGKIFVGLVQADGSIKWDYTYSVNNGTYAYSCLTELTDGSIGLLYESASAAITYANLPISTIASGAQIGEGNTDPTDPTEPAEPTDPKSQDITLYVGQSKVITDSTGNYAGSYTGEGLDTSVATVDVDGNDGTPDSVTYTEASVSCNALISGDSSNWTAASGYYYTPDGTNHYPVYAKRTYKNLRYTYTWGYSETDSDSDVTPIGSPQTVYFWDASSTDPSFAVYTQSGTAGTPDSTTITITGVAPGNTSVTVGNTTYNITVKEIPPLVDIDSTPFVANTGVGSGKKVTKLTTSVGLTFDLDLNITGTDVHWSVADSSIATVDQDGKVTGVKEGETTVTATIDDVSYSIPVVIRQDATSSSIKTYDFFMSEITNTTVYMSISTSTDLVEVQEGEAVYISFNSNADTAVDFFGTPDEGYALTRMSSTNSAGDYMALNSTDPTQTDFYTTDGAAGKNQRDTFGDTAVANMVQAALNKDCDGGMGWTRPSGNANNVTSDLTFRSEKLPTVEKEVAGVLGKSGLTGDYREYTEGMTAVEGETVFFKITVTKYASEDEIVYSDAVLNDKLSDAAFYESTGADGKPVTSGNTKDITSSITDSGLDAGTYTYYVLYTIQDSDLDTTIKNTVDLSYEYKSAYSSGTFGGEATADAKITATSFVAKDIVVDFGLPVTVHYAPWGTSSTVLESEGMAAYGSVAVTGDHVNGWDVTYTPKEILRGVDTVTLYSTNNAEYTFKVYPATTVYYEEGFATYSGSWTDTGSKGSEKQKAYVAGSSQDEYGYDAAYANGIGASNGTQATSSAKSDKADFTFTGTGVDIYANSTHETGWLMIQVKNGDGNTVKMVTVKLIQVDTSLKDGGEATTGQSVTGYNVPVASISGLSHSTYSVTISNISDSATVNLDGFRIYGTLSTEPDFYKTDKEDNPSFIELRDQVLAGLSVTSDGTGQVNAALPTNTKAVVVASSEKYTQDNVNDLLANGPKNEIYLQPEQALVLKITTSREVQIGLKALNAETNYTINGDSKDISTSTDMFYTVLNQGSSGQQIITITNNGGGILSVTKLKVCDDPNASLASLTWEDLANALVELGIGENPIDPVEPTDPVDPVNPTDPVEPTEPEQPEVVCKDATLTVSLVDYTGKQITSVDLTANGVEGETKAFTAGEVLAAAKANVPNGYVLVDESKVTGAEVAYGQSGKVTVQIGKTATLKVIYVNLRGKNVGTATFTKVQTSGGSLQISASDIRASAPAGRRAVWLTNVRVPYGSEMTIVVPTF